jgi:hypothetical protein
MKCMELIFDEYYLQIQNTSFIKSITELAWSYISSNNATKKIRCNTWLVNDNDKYC